MQLTKKHCVPCEGGVLPFNEMEAKTYLAETPDWQLDRDAKSISRTFGFKDFKAAIVFVNQVAEVAETEKHHPDINLFDWNKVAFTLATHTSKGLSENDFILAAKIDALL